MEELQLAISFLTKVPLRLQNDHDLWTGCISGAWYEPEFISDFKELGFKI